MARTPQDVTAAELAVLQVLWDRGPSTRRQIADAIYPGGGPAHSLWLLVLLKLITPPLFPIRLPWADPLAAAPEQAEDPISAGATRRLPEVDLPAAVALHPAAAAVRVSHQPPTPLPAEGWDG